jgi:hypothetical protein
MQSFGAYYYVEGLGWAVAEVHQHRGLTLFQIRDRFVEEVNRVVGLGAQQAEQVITQDLMLGLSADPWSCNGMTPTTAFHFFDQPAARREFSSRTQPRRRRGGRHVEPRATPSSATSPPRRQEQFARLSTCPRYFCPRY